MDYPWKHCTCFLPHLCNYHPHFRDTELYTMEMKYVGQGHYARIRSNIQTQLISDFIVHEFNPYTIVPPFNMIARI